ncbi:MAG: DeoR/GlpR transcriptional regulator [Chloroflexi bacterium]|nr:MAG: DeoR/GlpR transcriptional regulator [Chloroflexota bacterium]
MSLAKELYLEERRQAILARITEQGRASVAELSEALGVSGVTIRSDLQALADRKLIIRTHGGAIPAAGNQYEIALALRRQKQVQAKNQIGQAAAALVSDGDAIFVDSSSTALALLPHLKSRRQLTLITNSLAVAQEMQATPTVKVVMPGGTLHHDTASLIGVEGLKVLDKYNIQTGFFGAHGITLTEGLTDVDADEADVKRQLVAMCRRAVVLLDSTKWGQVGLAAFARPQDINTIITDSVPPDMAAQFRALGVEVTVV